MYGDCPVRIHLQMRRTSGCSRRTKGGPSEWPILPGEPQKSYQPFCGKFAPVNELLSVTLMFMFVITEITVCACIWEYFSFLIFQLNLLYHYILFSLFTFFVLRGWIMIGATDQFRVLFPFSCLPDS